MSDEVVYNRFIRVLDEWIAIHFEEQFFPKNPNLPQIKYTYGAQYIHANTAFTMLPKIIQEAMVAHELGHKHHQHGKNNDGQLRYVARIMATSEGDVEPNELEADRYACDLLGVVAYTAALRNRQEHARSNGHTLAAAELGLRAAILEEQVQ